MESSTVEKIKGTSYEVKCVVVEELAGGGELFYFVLNAGAFSNGVCIYYFK